MAKDVVKLPDVAGQVISPNTSVNQPAFTNRSTGTKIVLLSAIDSQNVDYAIGVETDNMRLSVPSSSQGFNWYAGTTRIARLNGSGVFLHRT